MDTTEKFAFGFLGISAVIAIVAVLSAFNAFSFTNSAQTDMGQKLTRMGLTSFDRVLAKEFMDKNGDGKCDSCGMPVEMCMDSGQMQCNMDSKSTIGILGSQHIHADWKIYINGKELDDAFFGTLAMDMQKTDNPITSSFIHLEKVTAAPEKTSDVLHMHANGVPLWIFFKSAGMDFSKDCLTLGDGKKFCNDGKKTLKFYVNGKPNSERENYVFRDMDKVLISYGSEDVSLQISSITDFAKNH